MTIAKEDLEDDDSLLRLYRGAVRHKVITSSDADRLNYFAAAERALDQADDPGALFAFLVKQRKWGDISDEDEDRAIRRLKRIDGTASEDRPRYHEDLDAMIHEAEEKIRHATRSGR